MASEAEHPKKENERQQSPWDPCDDCLDPLAEIYERLPECCPPPIFPSLELEKAHKQLDINVCRDWLLVQMRGDLADDFMEKLMTPLTLLRTWEARLRQMGYRTIAEVEAHAKQHPDVEGLLWELRSEYDDIMCETEETAKYLKRISIMLRGKLNRARTTSGQACIPESWELTATVALNEVGSVKSWRLSSTALSKPIRLTRCEGNCLVVLADAAKREVEHLVPLRGFRQPRRLYWEHRSSNPQRSLRSLRQKLGPLSDKVIEHAGPKGHRLVGDITVRLSMAQSDDNEYVRTITLSCRKASSQDPA